MFAVLVSNFITVALLLNVETNQSVRISHHKLYIIGFIGYHMIMRQRSMYLTGMILAIKYLWLAVSAILSKLNGNMNT